MQKPIPIVAKNAADKIKPAGIAYTSQGWNDNTNLFHFRWTNENKKQVNVGVNEKGVIKVYRVDQVDKLATLPGALQSIGRMEATPGPKKSGGKTDLSALETKSRPSALATNQQLPVIVKDAVKKLMDKFGSGIASKTLSGNVWLIKWTDTGAKNHVLTIKQNGAIVSYLVGGHKPVNFNWDKIPKAIRTKVESLKGADTSVYTGHSTQGDNHVFRWFKSGNIPIFVIVKPNGQLVDYRINNVQQIVPATTPVSPVTPVNPAPLYPNTPVVTIPNSDGTIAYETPYAYPSQQPAIDPNSPLAFLSTLTDSPIASGNSGNLISNAGEPAIDPGAGAIMENENKGSGGMILALIGIAGLFLLKKKRS